MQSANAGAGSRSIVIQSSARHRPAHPAQSVRVNRDWQPWPDESRMVRCSILKEPAMPSFRARLINRFLRLTTKSVWRPGLNIT
jgi:hypothetical protein